MGAAAIVTDILMAPTGSWLMAKDLWLPYKFVATLIFTGIAFIFALPETFVEQQAAKQLSSPSTTVSGVPSTGFLVFLSCFPSDPSHKALI